MRLLSQNIQKRGLATYLSLVLKRLSLSRVSIAGGEVSGRVLGKGHHAYLMTTCSMMYLPHGLAHLVLDTKGYTPREAWMNLYPSLAELHTEVDCTPLLDWLAGQVG
jgi:hypothetical protein